MTGFGTDPVAGHTLPINILLLVRAHPDAGPIVFEEMLRAFLDAGGTVGVLALGVLLPRVLDGVVSLHGRALLLAHSVVVKVAASQTVRLLRSSASSGAKQVTTLAGFRAKASTLVALGAGNVIKDTFLK